MYDNVKMVIFKNWVFGKEFRFSIGTNDNEIADERRRLSQRLPMMAADIGGGCNLIVKTSSKPKYLANTRTSDE